MLDRASNILEQIGQLLFGIVCCIWDTFELIWDILLEYLAKSIELIIAVINLIFQVICFLRDLCIETMQTFGNVFQGLLNVIRGITCDDVEDFASACIVVLLWIGAIKIVLNCTIGNKKPCSGSSCLLLSQYENDRNNNNVIAVSDYTEESYPRKRKRKKADRRYGKRRTASPSETASDEEPDN